MGYDMIAVMKEAKRRRRQALALANRGKTMQEIGATLGCSKQRASEIVAQARREQETPAPVSRGTARA